MMEETSYRTNKKTIKTNDFVAHVTFSTEGITGPTHGMKSSLKVDGT